MFSIRSPRKWLEEFRMATLAVPQDWMFDAFGSSKTMAGERISVDSSLALADVFAAVNLISEAIGSLPLKIYRDLRLSSLGEGIQEAPDHRCWRMLHDMPNPYVPANRFWSTITVHQLGWGNWFVEKLRDEFGQVAELRLLHPANVEIFWNETTGAKRFRVTRQSGQQETLDDDRVLHGFGVSKDGIVGMSPIQQSREALGVVAARQRFEGDAYGSHPYASAALMTPNKVKDIGRIRESWRSIYGSGSKDRGNVAVLEEGMTIQQLSMPMADLQFVESTHMSKTTIANIFKLPPSYIGGSLGDSLTYQTVESNKIWLATQTLAPVAHNIAFFLSRDFGLFPFQSWFCAFDMQALMRGDSAARAAYYEKMFALQDNDGKRALSIDEIRDEEGLGPATAEKPKPIPAALAAHALAGDGQTSAGNGTIPVVNANG